MTTNDWLMPSAVSLKANNSTRGIRLMPSIRGEERMSTAWEGHAIARNHSLPITFPGFEIFGLEEHVEYNRSKSERRATPYL